MYRGVSMATTLDSCNRRVTHTWWRTAGLLLSFLHSLSLWVRCYSVFVSSVWKQKNRKTSCSLSAAAWRRTINEPELRVTMLHTASATAAAAQVSLSEELHPKAAALARCCHLWPLTPLSMGRGGVYVEDSNHRCDCKKSLICESRLIWGAHVQKSRPPLTASCGADATGTCHRLKHHVPISCVQFHKNRFRVSRVTVKRADAR